MASRVAVENPPPVPQRRKKPPASKKSKNNPPLIFTLQDFENVKMDDSISSTVNKDDTDKVEFRVTTTNFPFEKCFDNINSLSINNDSAFISTDDKWLPTTPKKSPIKPRRIHESQLQSSSKIHQVNSKLNNSELKTEMLNELLNNFSSIKLREIPSLNDGKIKCELDDEKNIIIEKNNDKTIIDSTSTDNSACSVDKKTDNIDLAIKSCDRNGGSTAKPIGKPEIIISTAINSSQALRDDICAIVSYSNNNINNNIDNNTSTVPIICDQTSHNAVPISVIPGRVKNYVKHYELNEEQSSKQDSKSTENFKHTEGGIVRVLSLKYANNNLKSTSTLENDAKVHEKKLVLPENTSAVPKSPCLKNPGANEGGLDLKKSVKFNSTSLGSNLTKTKRKAPPRPPKTADTLIIAENNDRTTSNKTQQHMDQTAAIQGTKSDFVKPPYVFYYQL